MLSPTVIDPVYTLWKCPDLLPILSTPAPVIPKLINGADLMIPGGPPFRSLSHTAPDAARSKSSITHPACARASSWP